MLKAKGLGPFADLVAAATLHELGRSFADRVDPRGPRLIVRVTEVDLTSIPDGGGGDRWRGGRREAAPIRSTVKRWRSDRAAKSSPGIHSWPCSTVNTSAINPNEQGRAIAVAQHYVRWLRRELIS